MTLNRRRLLQTAAAALPAAFATAQAAPAASRIIDTHTHFYDPTRPEGVPWPPTDSKLLYRKVMPADWRALAEPHKLDGIEVFEDGARADLLVAERVQKLSLPTYPVSPSSCHVTVHEDKLGVARVVFVMNPTDARVDATFPVAKVLGLRDLLAAGYAETLVPESGTFTVRVPARTVRVFAAE